jgi:hypothetical protein
VLVAWYFLHNIQCIFPPFLWPLPRRSKGGATQGWGKALNAACGITIRIQPEEKLEMQPAVSIGVQPVYHPAKSLVFPHRTAYYLTRPCRSKWRGTCPGSYSGRTICRQSPYWEAASFIIFYVRKSLTACVEDVGIRHLLSYQEDMGLPGVHPALLHFLKTIACGALTHMQEHSEQSHHGDNDPLKENCNKTKGPQVSVQWLALVLCIWRI